MLPLHSLLRNRSERRQPDLVDKVPGLQPLLGSQLKLLVVEKTIVEALLDALVVQVLPDEHQLLPSVAPRPRLIIGCLIDVHILTTIYLPIVLGQCLQNLRLTRRPLPKVSVQKRLKIVERVKEVEESNKVKIVERKFLYLNSQSHGLYGLILMILPAC